MSSCESVGMKPYSEDLRLRVLAAVDRGRPRPEAARTFSVSVSTIKRYLRLRRETGGVEAKPIPGPPAPKRRVLEEGLPDQVRRNPDLTLAEHCEIFEEERDEEVRGLWRWLASRFAAKRLVFVDESGFHTSMARLRARAPRGKRAYGSVPRNRGKNRTLIASMTLTGAMGKSVCIDGGTTEAVFEAYVEGFLAPGLHEGQMVVLDGLGAHRTKRVRDLIEERGCELVFLPPYSPDFNPIEEAFSKIKNVVRKAGARTREALDEAIAEAMSAVTSLEVAGWFVHGGYESRGQYL